MSSTVCERFLTSSTTWTVKKSSAYYPTSPSFDLDNQKCSLKVNITPCQNGYQYQFNIAVSLNFTKSGSPLNHNELKVTLYFGNKENGHSFKLLNNALCLDDKSLIFNQFNSVTIYESALSSPTCAVTALIFYQKLEYQETPSLFIDDMKNMFKSEIHSDFQIKADSKIFNVHKAVIAIRSEVLKNMIDIDMLEKKSGQLELQADPIVVHELLEYLYTDRCKVSVAPTELFKLAHFLGIYELQMRCKNYSLSNINLKNIINILELTSFNNYDLKDLHNKAMDFVDKNEISLVTDLEFQGFLCDSIKLETITYILRLSYKHQLGNILEKSMEFIRKNYKEVLKDEDFCEYLKSQPDLNLLILEYCLNFSSTPCDEK